MSPSVSAPVSVVLGDSDSSSSMPIQSYVLDDSDSLSSKSGGVVDFGDRVCQCRGGASEAMCSKALNEICLLNEKAGSSEYDEVCAACTVDTMGTERCKSALDDSLAAASDKELCDGYTWYQDNWSECSDECGGGERHATVYCANDAGDKVDNSFCWWWSVPPSKEPVSFI